MVEILHRFCRTRACVYVESDSRGGQPVHCFQDFEGRRLYRTPEEILAELGTRPEDVQANG